MKYILIIAIILVFASCKKNNTAESPGVAKTTKQKIERSGNDISPLKPQDLKEKIINEGDSGSYETLCIYYLDYPVSEEQLFYSIIMAEEYNYLQAYYDAFDCIYLLYRDKPEKISKGLSEMAIKYLLRAAKLGHHQAAWHVERFNITDNTDACVLMQKILKE